MKQIDSKFVLQVDNWNDYGYYTLYHLHYRYGDSQTDVTYVGAVKILKHGQDEGEYSLIKEPFASLGPDFVSVGTSFDYYQRLNEMPEADRKFIMDALQDAVANTPLVAKFQDEPGWLKSVFRDDSDWQKFLSAARVIYEGSYSALPEIDDRFSFSPANSKDEIRFDFASPQPDFYTGPYRKIRGKKTILPNRIIVLVGRNGSGKSTLLSRLAHVAFASPQNRRTAEIKRYGELVPNSIGFMRIITISYSAFDSFMLPGIGTKDLEQISEDIQSGTGRFVFCGLRDIAAEAKEDLALSEQQRKELTEIERRTFTRLKSIDMLAKEFGRLTANIQENKLTDLFELALQPLLSEPSFVELNYQVSTLLKATQEEASELFLKFSTGHKIVLHVVASLVVNTKPQSLVLFDEPETHLHPPLMAALMHSVRLVLTDLDAFCVVATHSPVLLQETLALHVRYIRRIGDELKVATSRIETFGENVGILTYNSFGLTASSTDYHNSLDLIIAGCNTIEEVHEFFPNGLSGQALAYVYSKLAEKNQN